MAMRYRRRWAERRPWWRIRTRLTEEAKSKGRDKESRASNKELASQMGDASRGTAGQGSQLAR
jgi:hypothetical protein